ncbi:SCO3374 family protein [Streptomyces yerevanensis]|uniref:SCO3374 family protein n=1 Tax=Streptomyces yerevanensis TaxID=66378 RepID=UPI000527812A|nr:SCO3374 family protein [Streptomyces yerevanensis]
MVPTIPLPRRPLNADDTDDQVRHWYENELGWATVPGPPVELLTGLRFDVLEVPAEAGYAALRHLRPGSPVAVQADRMRLLVAAGSADELPGLLDWLEWGSLALDIRAIGAGGRIEAPLPRNTRSTRTSTVDGSQGAAVWLRPPEPDCEVEPALPTLSALGGGGGGAPDLVRLVDTMATQCHRIRLRQGRSQALAFS